MSQLELALPTIWLHEGRYSNHASDPGGRTNFGISLRFLLKTGDLDNDSWLDGDINHDGIIDAHDIRALTEEKATTLYNLYWWQPNSYEKINDQDIATKVFDLAINMGAMGSHKILQRAIRSANGVHLKEDGILGSSTLQAANDCHPPLLLAALKSEAAGYYRNIRYRGSEDYLNGWLNRAYSNSVKSTDLIK